MSNEQLTLEQLQEEALQYEIDIEDEQGNLLSFDDLKAKLDEFKMLPGDEEEAPPEPPQAPPTPAKRTGKVKAPATQEAPSAGLQKRSTGNVRTLANTPAGKGYKSRAPEERFGLTPTDADFALADKYDYPIAIPGAKPYFLKFTSVVCAYGGGERAMGTVILLTDAHAANKREYLRPVTP